MKNNYFIKVLSISTFIFSIIECSFSQGWFDTAWSYQRAVTIENSNNPNILVDYQVRVSLDSSNFDFSKALADGADLRVTDEDGITSLLFWIES